MMWWALAQEAPQVQANLWVLLGGWATTILVAYIGSGVQTRRAVSRHGTEEMRMGEEIRSELELLRRAQTATNELVAQFANTSSMRMTMIEKRLDRLDTHV